MMKNTINITVDTTKPAKKIDNTFSTICVWDFNDFSDDCFGGMPEGWYKSVYPFIDSVILMTFTGGKGYNEWYTEDENSVGHMDFSAPIHILQNVVRQGVLPVIVIGNVPYALSDHRDTEQDSYGWGNRCPPRDYCLYYQYIKAFANAIKSAFPDETYSKFVFRIGTECDNPHWFLGSQVEYFKLYDYTVAALTDSLGDTVKIGPTNLESLEKYPDLLKHCAVGKNYVTGKTGTKCDFFSFSHYDLGNPPETRIAYTKKAQTAVARLKEYPQLCNAELNVGEGQFLSDGMQPPHRLHMAQDCTEYGASWHAQNFAVSLKYGISFFANWAYCCDYKRLHEPLVRTPAYFAALLCSKMSGLPSLKITADNSSGATGAIAALDETGKRIYVLCYSHEEKRNGDDTNMTVTVKDCHAVRQCRAFRIDRSHNNFSSRWLSESENISRVETPADFDTLGSLVETEISETLPIESLDFWLTRKSDYVAEKPDVTKQPFTCNPDFETSVFLPHHSVVLLELDL